MGAYLGYGFLVVCVVTSIMVFTYGGQSEYHRSQFHARLAAQWRTTRYRIRERFSDDQLNELLSQSGLKISAPLYHYIRLLLTAFTLVIAVLTLLTKHNMIVVMIPIVIWFFFAYKKPFPMHYIFIALQKQAAEERNKSLYLLNRLLYQEILAFQQAPRNLYDMLERQLPRVSTIQSFLQKCLDHWVDNPEVALHQFARDLGSKQAQTLVDMLIQIEQAGPDIALDVFRNNQESFRTDRIAAFKSQLSTRALIGTALTLLGFGAVSYDINQVIQIYTQSLMAFN